MMKRLVALTLVSAAGAAGAFETPPQIFRPGSVVLFQGDSVTHGGRMGDMNHFMGHGYQAEIAMRYLAYRPDDSLQFGNRGESGHTSSNLVARWHRDAFPYEAREAGYRGAFDVTETKLTPDYLSILIGINDYLRTDGWQVSAEDYERNLRYMVTNSLALNPNVRIVLCEPFRLPVDTNPDFVRRQRSVRAVAEEYNLAFVPFQKLFTDLLKVNSRPRYWFWDAFHPTYAGHMKMADFWIETVQQEFAAGRGSPKLRTSLRSVMPAIPDANWTKGWWMPRHEQKLAEIRKIGNPKVVFLGDSITHFWEDSGRGLKVWNKYFTNETYKAINLGFSGDRTEHVLWRIAHGELDGYQAKAVVLMLGTNNTGHFPIEKEPPEATVLGMQAVVRAIRARQSQAKLVICAIFPCDAKADGQRRLRNEIVNKEIQKLADGRNVFWLDFTTSFLTADGELLGEIMSDRLHPATHGYEIWANAVLPYLNHALTAKDGEALLFPSTFAPRVKPEVTGAHTMPARPVATFGMRWWGEFADRPLETMKRIADNPVLKVDEKGVTNRWFDVVMVGDSITHRWERGGCGGEETWALLTNRYSILNLGYGGDSTEHCLWRMKYGELYGYKAKLFTVMIGTNNNGAPGTSRGIEAIVRTIREIHPESKVVVLDIFPRNAKADDAMRRKCAEISAEARQFLGDKDPNVVFLDLNAKFLEPDGTLTKEMFPDLLHPAAKGYRAWYDAILPTIQEIVGK